MLKELIYRLLAHGVRPFINNSPAISVFMFHGLHEDNPSQLVCNSSRSISNFRQGVDALAANFDIITMDEAIDRLSAESSNDRHAVVLTFDDSIRCVLPAAEYLASRKIPGLFYLSTSTLDHHCLYWWHRLEFAVFHTKKLRFSIEIGDNTFDVKQQSKDLSSVKAALKRLPRSEIETTLTTIEELLGCALTQREEEYPCAQPMTWIHAERLKQLGMTIGSHGVSHSNMALLETSALHSEFSDSKQKLESRLNIECRHFSYPYGISTPGARKMAIDTGYSSAVTAGTNERLQTNADCWSLDRLSMHTAPWKSIFQAGGEDCAIANIRKLTPFR